MNEQELIGIVAEVLEVDAGLITMETKMSDFSQWDSISHLGILVKLDDALEGKAAGIRALAEATSLREIMTILDATIPR